jgi:hypothetical protein
MSGAIPQSPIRLHDVVISKAQAVEGRNVVKVFPEIIVILFLTIESVIFKRVS